MSSPDVKPVAGLFPHTSDAHTYMIESGYPQLLAFDSSHLNLSTDNRATTKTATVRIDSGVPRRCWTSAVAADDGLIYQPSCALCNPPRTCAAGVGYSCSNLLQWVQWVQWVSMPTYV